MSDIDQVHQVNFAPLPWYKKNIPTTKEFFTMPPAVIQVLKAVATAVAATVVAILASGSSNPPNDDPK